MKLPTLLFAVLLMPICGAFAENDALRDLFSNGKLDAWNGAGYVLNEGVLTATEKSEMLVSKALYTRYVLDFDFKLPAEGSHTLVLHYAGQGDPQKSGVAIPLLGATANAAAVPTQAHGSIAGLVASVSPALKPAGEWNHQRITVVESSIAIELNGAMISRANLNDLSAKQPDHLGLKQRAGQIVFLGRGSGASFRNVKIHEMVPAANTAGVTEAGFKPLFDGKSLQGWVHDPATTREWFAQDGALKHTGKLGEPRNLWTEKTYGDFTMVFDWRWSHRGNIMPQPIIESNGKIKLDEKGEPQRIEVEEQDSGIFIRGNEKSQVNLWNWSVGSGEIYGYRHEDSTPDEVRAACTPKLRADQPTGVWNRMMIQAKGNRVSVSLNGRVVIEAADLSEMPARGPIGIQHHGQALEFANVWIREESTPSTTDSATHDNP